MELKCDFSGWMYELIECVKITLQKHFIQIIAFPTRLLAILLLVYSKLIKNLKL